MNSIIKTFKFTITLLSVTLILLSYSCKSDSENKNNSVQMDDVYSQLNSELGDKQNHEHDHGQMASINEGTVIDVLYTDKYAYLQLENKTDGKFWVAISKQEINKGDRILFEEGLMKKNFVSKEFNRTFETIYLVSRFQHLNKTGENIAMTQPSAPINKEVNVVENKLGKTKKKQDPSGSVKLESIFHNLNEYKDQEVIVSGLVTKVNYNIMGKNWIHLIDKESTHAHDLTITTNDEVMEGEELSFKGVIRLNKDFGSGYKYDVIMEDAKRQ